MQLLKLIPLVDEADALAADFVEFGFVVYHVFSGCACDKVFFAEVDCLLWADFFTHAAIDAASHVDIKFLRTLLHFCPLIISRDLTGNDFDGFRWADKFTKLAGNTALAILLVGDEGWCTAIVLREEVVPPLFRELHRDAET